MTYEEAKLEADKGKPIRHRGMSKGWAVQRMLKDNLDLFAINSHTGSNYKYTPSLEEKQRDDWSVVEG